MCVQFKILNVPLSSHLAANHFNQQQAEQEERMRMKKLTLDINERQEQEDYQGESHVLHSVFQISVKSLLILEFIAVCMCL